ncbi:MAG: hypothetical protein PHV13_05480 [Candidatus ainarchaeum sp.]|nr:hypothetical protein [Candidatus ainarchaeum sp.]
MGEAKIRLVYNYSLGPRERKAAYDAARSFADFGVKYDFTDANNLKALEQVKFGDKLGKVVSAKEALVESKDFTQTSLLGHIFAKKIFGIGVTQNPLWVPAGGELEYGVGVGIPGVGGVVSTYLFSRDELKGDLLDRAITAAVRVEIGHVFDATDHSVKVPCIMYSSKNFVEEVVKPGLDFCRDCHILISAGVAKAMQQ